jgi:carboxypeptidase family protein/F5/8 type C domain-containing protein
MTHRKSLRRVSWSAPVLVAVILGSLALSVATPQGQAVPGGPLPTVVQLQRGRPFQGDLRQLPTSLPSQVEHRPSHGEDPMLPPVSFGDQAPQTSLPGGAAPVPPPGSGAGAGSFPGLDYVHNGDGWPPDTNGDVGPTYYIQTVNASYGVFRKSDGVLVAGSSFNTLMSQGNFGNACDNENFGDPVVVWDSSADRWIISDFAFALDSQGNPVAPYFQCFAVSRTGDPVSGGWNFYSLQTTDFFPDYPKLGVWPDGLYLTANLFRGNNFKNVRVWALNKTQMYAGAATSSVIFNLPASVQGVSVFTGIPSTYHSVTGAPPAGRPNFISVIWSAKSARVWKFHVDWNNTANSTLTGPSNVTLATWGTAGTSVPAKNGNALDSLRERLMVQSQYTNQGGVEAVWLTHTVANPSNSALTSPRWYQLNVTGGTVVTSGPVQQSTWGPDSTVARWMPSLAVDKDGNMAIGYSASSSTLFPAIRYAGRLATDPAGTLGQSETSLIEGGAAQCCSFSSGALNNRWGDYSAMTIDPDGCTFWYTNEFYQLPQPQSLAEDNWQTRIGSFKFSSCAPNSATLSGNVTDSATGNPISGATVTAGSSSTTSSGSGQYTLSSLTPGTYTATASASGYTSASASVTVYSGVTTTQNFALVANAGAAATSLAVAAASGTYGGTTTLSATLTSAGTGVSGKSITFSLSGNSVGSASTDGSGTASLTNVSLSGIGAGTYASGVSASFAGDASYTSSSGANSLTVSKASQTITFSALSGKTYGDPPFVVSATASSGLTVSFSASGNCTVASTTVTITGAGSCTITASQAGNSNYFAATDVPQTFSIAKASQTITFGALSDKTTSDPPFTVTATASSGLPVSFAASGSCTVSGSTVTITAAGSCTITASQSGNANFNPASSVPRTFNITGGGGGTAINVALASNGATASGSSVYSSAYSPAGAINGDRKGQNWGSGGGWNDATSGAFPDWLEVDFSAPSSINQINVFSLQDNYQSPIEPTSTTTFSLYGLTAFDVQYWTGSNWVTVPGGTITGNSLVKRTVTFATITTQRIRVVVNSAVDIWSRITEVEAFTDSGAPPPPPPPPPPVNVALATAGAVATASSFYSSGYSPDGAINGDRSGMNWGAGGGWNDATSGVFPDWLEVDFANTYSINQINVFSVQDNYQSPVDPDDTKTFTLYGLTSFVVQYWTGTTWAAVPGGTIDGNTLVKRAVTFAPVSTQKIRVLVNNAVDVWSRITEVEAFAAP